MYVMVPYKLRAFANHRWVAPPAQMLLPMIAERIRSKGYFKAVVTPPFTGLATYRLDSQLLMLQQEFMRPVSLVRLIMQTEIINSKTNKIVAAKRFVVTMKAPENNPYDGVLAANQAAAKLTQQIAAFVIRSIRQ